MLLFLPGAHFLPGAEMCILKKRVWLTGKLIMMI